MRAKLLRGAALAVALLAVLPGNRGMSGTPASAQEGAPLGALEVSLSRSEVSTQTGDTFEFTSEIRNGGSEATAPLIANLNFAALDQGTYVDPEDWSPRRTVTLDPIAAGSSATISWTVKPVLKGDIAVYVVVMPGAPDPAAAEPLAASPAILVHVGEHRSLNPGGVLPVVLAVPGLIAVAFVGMRLARARR